MGSWKEKIYIVIFEADTRAGKIFDLTLIASIIISVIVVMLDSVEKIHSRHGELLVAAEWFFTILFTVEYILRLLCIKNPIRYAKSFYGVIDLLAILPTYLSLIVPGAQHFMVIRILRILRIFRVLKLVRFVREANFFLYALEENRNRIIVFLFSVLSMVVIFGSVMYLIENPYNSGFTSIPIGIYWAIVTMTTVGYGDISPSTAIGQSLAALLMITGYSIIAVPAGFFTVEFVRTLKKKWLSSRVCPHCSAEGHDEDAYFCKFCGFRLSSGQ